MTTMAIQSPASEEQSPNTNCLKYLKCPTCGSSSRFRITVTCWANVSDDGIEDYSDAEWDQGSFIVCSNCGHRCGLHHHAEG